MLRKGVERIIEAGLKAGMPVTDIAQAILFYTEGKVIPLYVKAGFYDPACWFNDDPQLYEIEKDNEAYATIMIFATSAAEGDRAKKLPDEVTTRLDALFSWQKVYEVADLTDVINSKRVPELSDYKDTAKFYEAYFNKGGENA